VPLFVPEREGATANTIQPRAARTRWGIYGCVFDQANLRAVQFGGSTGKQYFFQGNYDAATRRWTW